MSMIKIRIEMDEGWVWWPVTETQRAEYEKAMGFDAALSLATRRPLTMEVDQDFITRYEAVYAAYREMRGALEQLYRVQEGLAPWDTPGVIEHTLLKQG
jgi:hypothetical protein